VAQTKRVKNLIGQKANPGNGRLLPTMLKSFEAPCRKRPNQGFLILPSKKIKKPPRQRFKSCRRR